MKRTMMYAKHLAVAALLTQLPTALRADCMPSGATGDTVPFTMIKLKNNQVATYAAGGLQLSNSGVAYSLNRSTTVSGSQIPELFSNRQTCLTGELCATEQPFYIGEPEQLAVSITESTSWSAVPPVGPATGITITLTDSSGTFSFTGTCNAAGELYGTYESNTSALFAFGTPVAPVGPPK